jgi:hypothetical protein
MTPNQVSGILRKIASAIENSKRPNPEFVVADLKTVIANIETTGQQQEQQQEQQGQQQQQALPKSGPGQSMLKKLLSDAQKALDAGDDAGFKGALEALQKNAL